MPELKDAQLGYKRQSRWVIALVGFGLSVIFILALSLSREVMSDLERQSSASSDNVQWTLTQVEVEHLAFLTALEHRMYDPGGTLPFASDLGEVRQQFDIFYSRIDTLQSSRLFAELREDPAFAQPLSSIMSFLDRTVPLIDGPDERLDAELWVIWEDAAALRDEVRALAIGGLSYFAQTADARRNDTARTLRDLAALSAVLLLTLTLVSLYLLRANQIAQRRGNELVQTNHRMNTILSTSLDAVIVSDASGRVLEFNPAAEATFGYSLEEARGRTIGELIVPPHMREAHDKGMKRMQEGGERRVVGHGRVQLEGMRANGEIFPVELALQSARDGDNEIMIGFLRDISKRVASEKELTSARDRALAGEKAKTDFLTVMSHEIRTPLNGLLGNLSLLKNARPSQEQLRFIHNMDVSGQVLLNHVDTVLDIARFEAGKLNAKTETLDLGTFMQEIVDGQSGNAASRGNVIEWLWAGPAHPWVKTDTQRLRQILLNLVGNAIKFTENGRISLELERAESTADPQKSIYEFRVIDTGIGIAPENLDRVFEDFHTNDASIGRSTGGAGLGLGIASRFTRALGGEIGVESTPGEGSVFWIRLQLRHAEAGTTGLEASPVSHVRGLDLLVVEDNPINLEVIRNMLMLDGHTVTEAMDGKSGVEAAGSRRFDAILMDMSMPVMDGATATRLIRAGGGPSADAPILAVSANVLPDAVAGFRAAGVTAFLGKPISLKALRDALAAITEADTKDGMISVDEGDAHLAQLREDLGLNAFPELVSQLVAEGDALMSKLARPSRTRRALDDLAAECHKFAGSVAMFGALEMRDALVEYERAAKTKDEGALPTLAQRAKGAWSRARKRLTNTP
ncbi:PAS domain S-box-containing protein [Roseivivax halotolerans]|uniref:histidine kinase n=1 Tax=Roseivivax halotolerans TaxID=93684 RepID=A0A1I6ALX6_9RHOB|nr:PAS domain-containing hybrid sensor histidine kinase/response regulator [Roseivivax halotolerans]SFQ69694.1 PAS domain S-box-containing protein [Roseivivax halotolerans]